jgi:nucleotide-binding universal stress UspA family protein
MKSLFVPVLGTQSDHHALTAARSLAARFGATVDCVHVRLDINGALALATRETTWRIEKEENERSATAHAEFDRVFGPGSVGGAPQSGVKAQWSEVVGYPSDEYAYHGRMHDVVVVARERLLPEHCGQMVMETGRPVIVACARPVQTIGETVLVAWNNSPESAKALTAAMPVLTRAKKVILAASPPPVIDEENARQSLEQLRALLSLHAIQPEIRLLTKGDEANALKETAYEANCDLVVMGAYGHSRLREYLFGGVTREFLRECEIPVMLLH